jgi:hypothetical protein
MIVLLLDLLALLLLQQILRIVVQQPLPLVEPYVSP